MSEAKFLFEYPDLPPVPQKYQQQLMQGFWACVKNDDIFWPFIDHVYSVDEPEPVIDRGSPDTLGYFDPDMIYANLELNGRSKDDMVHSCSYTFPMPPGFNQWIKDNIMPDGIPKIFVFGKGRTVLPHRDPRDDDAFNYLFETAGAAKTTFWQPREEFKNRRVQPKAYIPYERIEKIAEYIVPPRTWYHFNPAFIHSVEEMDPTQYRVILSVDNQVPNHGEISLSQFKDKK